MLSYKNIFEKINLVKENKLSLPDNVQSFLDSIEQKKNLNAFNFIFSDDALNDSIRIEKKIKSGKYGRLAGLVVSVKDVLAVKDKPLTCSSKILKNFISLYNAAAVQKLIDDDAIIIGKTNCDEFAMGSSNENSAFGPVLNPFNSKHVPGGSSGGSAVSVAAGLSDASIGTDTGGSIRQPAAFCGIYGFKPSYGMVSRYGLTAFASSFDTIGPLSNNLIDAARIYEVISGYDEKDSTSVNSDAQKFNENITEDKNKIRIGIPDEYFGEGLSPEINNAIQTVIEKLKKEEFEIIKINLPYTEYTISTYYIIANAEASSNLARYDGARYGYRSAEGSNISGMYKYTRSKGFGPEVKRRIMLGTYVLSAGYYEAYYKKAQSVRRLINDDFDKAFGKVDLILTPTTPTTAFRIGEKHQSPMQMYLNDIYTTSANLAGIPAVSIPIANDSSGLPIGMQLIANKFKDMYLLTAANYIMQKIVK